MGFLRYPIRETTEELPKTLPYLGGLKAAMPLVRRMPARALLSNARRRRIRFVFFKFAVSTPKAREEQPVALVIPIG
jgi:hypothetical protein